MPIRIAVEGCGHGTLNAIYSSIATACEVQGWSGIDLLIIGGDFQAVRNSYDLNAMSVPNKYKAIGDFHEYYSGARKAPYLTLFIGGNHEASNHLSELFYGGWAAPNIYFLGASNVVRFGNLRISGLSGIWKGFDYNKPHFEVLPYSRDDVKSVYHVREIDVRRLLCVRYPIDIGLSHDWPRGVEWMGDWKDLFRRKKFLEPDARSGNLGSIAARKVLDRLRPKHWFSAHLHCKYAAAVRHEVRPTSQESTISKDSVSEKQLNDEEIQLDLGESDTERQPNEADANVPKTSSNLTASLVPLSIQNQLPASFRAQPVIDVVDKAVVPPTITNSTTKFLALDKCLPNRHFLQLLEIDGDQSGAVGSETPQLMYDKEWLAITRVFATEIVSSTSSGLVTKDKGYSHYSTRIDEELCWVEENIVRKNLMDIPENFQVTAPIYDPKVSIYTRQHPSRYMNPQTEAFCRMLNIEAPFSEK